MCNVQSHGQWMPHAPSRPTGSTVGWIIGLSGPDPVCGLYLWHPWLKSLKKTLICPGFYGSRNWPRINKDINTYEFVDESCIFWNPKELKKNSSLGLDCLEWPDCVRKSWMYHCPNFVRDQNMDLNLGLILEHKPVSKQTDIMHRFHKHGDLMWKKWVYSLDRETIESLAWMFCFKNISGK